MILLQFSYKLHSFTWPDYWPSSTINRLKYNLWHLRSCHLIKNFQLQTLQCRMRRNTIIEIQNALHCTPQLHLHHMMTEGMLLNRRLFSSSWCRTDGSSNRNFLKSGWDLPPWELVGNCHRFPPPAQVSKGLNHLSTSDPCHLSDSSGIPFLNCMFTSLHPTANIT